MSTPAVGTHFDDNNEPTKLTVRFEKDNRVERAEFKVENGVWVQTYRAYANNN